MPNPYLKKVDLSSTPKKPVILNNQPVQVPWKNPYNKKSSLKKKNCVTFDLSSVKNIHFAEISWNNFADNSYVVSDGLDCLNDVANVN